MKTRILSVFMLMLTGFGGYAQSLSGKEMFAGNCKACHSIGGGDIVGPDLAGLTERREVDWIKRFINNSQDLIREGDEQAVEVFNKYNKIAMPTHKFSDEELNELISYMEEAGLEASAASQKAEVVEKESDNPEVSEAGVNTGGSNLMVNLIFAVLGICAVILSGIAIYLIRILKSKEII